MVVTDLKNVVTRKTYLKFFFVDMVLYSFLYKTFVKFIVFELYIFKNVKYATRLFIEYNRRGETSCLQMPFATWLETMGFDTPSVVVTFLGNLE